ncbi:MAG: peptidoglycan DD-metalloendopeptidase family protein [Micromonosporaceae bacterium]
MPRGRLRKMLHPQVGLVAAAAASLWLPNLPTPVSAEDALVEQVTQQLVRRAEQLGERAGARDARVTVGRRTGDAWAFGTGVVTAPARPRAYPFGWLFIAHREGGGWRVGFDGEPGFAELAARAPVVSDGERELLTVRGEADRRTGMRLPFGIGQTWSYTGGPHQMGGSVLSSIDLAGGDLKVLAARGGRAYTMCKGWIRVLHLGGYATDYYHLWNQVKVDGTPVSEGTVLGDAGTDVTCGGGATGRHLHFSLRKDGEYVSIAGHGVGKWVIYNGGAAYEGYALHGSRRADVGNTVTNYGALRGDQGIVDTDGGGTLRRRSGPGTDHDIVGELADGATVTIVCTARGTSHTGRGGTTTLWNKLTDGSWVSHAYVWTGTDQPLKGAC